MPDDCGGYVTDALWHQKPSPKINSEMNEGRLIYPRRETGA